MQLNCTIPINIDKIVSKRHLKKRSKSYNEHKMKNHFMENAIIILFIMQKILTNSICFIFHFIF